MRHVRIFVSSPGDVDAERRRVEQIAGRLNGELGGAVSLETIRWEARWYGAHATFQEQIPEAAECDIVVGIFHARLGTELPADFRRMPDGQPYPSGSAYEVLSAIEARRRCGDQPDVFIFRRSDPPAVPLGDTERYLRAKDQWDRVKTFFETWFATPDGETKRAFHAFSSTDDFGAQLETLLRAWLAENVLRSRIVSWSVEEKGSPFRGLAAFGAKHASVFFGRSRDIARAVARFRQAAERGTPFLLIVGASGSGKSSLARAGISPRLTTPGVVPHVDLWRVAIMRPTEFQGGSIATLAACLMQPTAEIPEGESGRLPALPELAEGDFRKPAELAALLRRAGEAAVPPILRTLDRLGEAEARRGGYRRALRADLLLIVDQLDELFGADIPPEESAAFSEALGALAATGRIWIAATLRADLYEQLLESPALTALKARGETYDLTLPGPAELAEIVREPARAAGLSFEADPVSGEQLDERLLRDAELPGMLPLLQLALNRLFEERAVVDGAARLTVSAYDALGGLAGVIDREAERAVAGLAEADLACLPRLIRQLATLSRDGSGRSATTLTIRTVPLAAAAPDEACGRLVRALTEVRLLLFSGEGADRGVHLVHQRVLADWVRVRELVAGDADFYRIRDEVEDQRRRWEGAGRRPELLIPPGLPLAEAEAVAAQFGAEIPTDSAAFIRASGFAARRRRRLTKAVVAAVSLLAIGTIGGGLIAWLARQDAMSEQVRSFEERGVAALAESDAASAEVLFAHALRVGAESPLAFILHIRNDAPTEQFLAQARAHAPRLAWSWHHAPGSILALSRRGDAYAVQDGAGIELWSVGANTSRLFLPHLGRIAAATFSFDGREFAVGSGEELEVWSLDGSEPAAQTFAVGHPIRSLAFRRDGAAIAVGGLDRALCIVQTTARAVPHCDEFTHRDEIVAVAFSPDGRRLASGSWDNTVLLWDAATLKEPKPLRGHGDAVLSLAFSEDGQSLASGSWDNTIRIWKLAKGEASVLEGHAGGVLDVAFSADGTFLASGSEDRTTRLWKLETGRTVLKTPASPDQVGHVALAGDAARPELVLADRSGHVQMWDVHSRRQEVDVLRGHAGPVSAVAFHPKRQQLATASWDRTIRLWELPRDVSAEPITEHPDEITAVAFSPDGKWMASVDKQSFLRLQNLASGRQPWLHRIAETALRKVAFSPDSRRIAAAGDDDQIRIWELAEDGPRGPLASIRAEHGGVLGLDFSPDGTLLASSGRDGAIRLWQTADWALRRELTAKEKEGEAGVQDDKPGRKAHEKEVWQIVFSPDGRLLASASDDRSAGLWDVETGREVQKLEHKGAVWSVDFTPDGRILATGDQDATVQLFGIQAGSSGVTAVRSLLLRLCDGPVWSLQFSRDRAAPLLAVAGADMTIRLWNLRAFEGLVSNPRATEQSAERQTGLHVSSERDAPWCFAEASGSPALKIEP